MMMSEHSVMGFGRKANIPVVKETTMDTDGIGGDDIVTPPGERFLEKTSNQKQETKFSADTSFSILTDPTVSLD